MGCSFGLYRPILIPATLPAMFYGATTTNPPAVQRAPRRPFLAASNFAKRLNTLCGLTPFEAVCKAWAGESHRFRRDPIHLTLGLNT
jgi:hypothetical protein